MVGKKESEDIEDYLAAIAREDFLAFQEATEEDEDTDSIEELLEDDENELEEITEEEDKVMPKQEDDMTQYEKQETEYAYAPIYKEHYSTDAPE